MANNTVYVPSPPSEEHLSPVLQNQLYANNVTLFLLTAGGNPQKPHFWQYHYDDAAVWVGSPTSNNTLRLLTQQKVYGQGGQVPPNQFKSENFYDDPPMWQGQPVPSWIIPELTQQKVYGQGGQVPTPTWLERYTQDDPPVWQYAFQRNIALLKSGAPFTPNFTFGLYYDDTSFWSGSPTSDNTLRLLTEGGQPPTPEWLPRYTQDDPPVWQYAFRQNLALLGNEPFKPNFWQYNYDDAAVWSGSPTADNTLRLLTEGGQPPTPEWLPRYTQDDPAFWQGAPVPRNYALYNLLAPTPFFNPQFNQFSYDDSAVWVGSPTSDNTLRLLTEQTPRKPNFWKHDYDEGGIWVGSPTSDNTIRLLTEGGQPPTPEWLPRYTYDDAAFWQGAPVPQNRSLFNLLTLSPFSNPQFQQFTYDDPPVTDRQISLQRFLGQADIRFTPTAKPSFWTSIEDSPFWQGNPVPSWILRELTQQTPFKPSAWRNDYDDQGLWYSPSHKNLALKATPTFQAAWAINSNIVVGGVAT